VFSTLQTAKQAVYQGFLTLSAAKIYFANSLLGRYRATKKSPISDRQPTAKASPSHHLSQGPPLIHPAWR